MSTKSITERLDDFIDELLLRTDIRSSSLVSMLSAIRESVVGDYHVAMARHVWDARNLLAAPPSDADVNIILDVDVDVDGEVDESEEVSISVVALAK